MSAIGPKQTWARALHMSAFGGKADIAQSCGHNPKRTFNACVIGTETSATHGTGPPKKNPAPGHGAARQTNVRRWILDPKLSMSAECAIFGNHPHSPALISRSS
jgi:hypothetical protein